MHVDTVVKNRGSRLLSPIWGLLLVLLWLLTACSGQVTDGSGQEGLTWEILKNAEFRYQDARIRLTDGAYRQSEDTGPAITVILYDAIAFGDLNADGAEDAAVILEINAGADKTYSYLAAVFNQNGVPYSFSSESLGEISTIHDLSIDSGDILLDLTVREANDQAGVSSRRVTRRYQLAGSRLDLTSENTVKVAEDVSEAVSAPASTILLDYDVQLPAGETREGICWGASLSVPAEYAWRCVVGNQLFDPCFAFDDAPGMVCGVDPLSGATGFSVELTQPLPEQKAPAMGSDIAWMAKLADDTICIFDAAGAGSVEGKRVSYLCEQSDMVSSEVVLLGDLRPGDVWMAEKATVSAGEDGLRILKSEWVAVQTIVQGPARREVPAVPEKSGISTVQPAATTTATISATATATCPPDVTSESEQVPTVTPAAIPPKPERVEFGLGTTSTTIETTLAAGETRTYVFRALAGQTLLTDVMSPEQDVQMEVYAAEPTMALEPQRVTSTSWVGRLPESRDYLIELTARGETARCTLQMVIPKVIALDSADSPAILRSNINAGYILDYIVHARAGQTLSATITSPGDDVLLSLYGLDDGIPLVRSASDATEWTGELPATQNYVLKAVSVGETTNYRLTLELK